MVGQGLFVTFPIWWRLPMQTSLNYKAVTSLKRIAEACQQTITEKSAKWQAGRYCHLHIEKGTISVISPLLWQPTHATPPHCSQGSSTPGIVFQGGCRELLRNGKALLWGHCSHGTYWLPLCLRFKIVIQIWSTNMSLRLLLITF